MRKKEGLPKILLINPPIKGSPYKTPPLGIAYVGAALKRVGHEVMLIDCCLEEISIDEIIRSVARLAPDYVGVTGFAIQYPAVRELFPAIKRVNPAITTVFGGHHASVLTEYVMKDIPEIDFAIKGEGEIAFPALIKTLISRDGDNKDLKLIPGVAFREQDRIIVNPPLPIADLDGLEYPWQVTNPSDYSKGIGHGFTAKRIPCCPVISSRGCPYQCTYCGGPLVLGRKVRLREPKRFVDEIEYLINTLGVREIQIVDDNFTFYKEHATQVCTELLERKLNIPWTLPNGVRADRLDYKLLDLMRKAGCYYIAFGIEFGSERMLKLTKKALHLERVKQSVNWAAKLGYITQGFFMLGHPLERKEDILATLELSQALPLDRISVDFVMPLPGSELFEYYLQKGYLDLEHIDWEQFGNRKFIPKTEFIASSELMNLSKRANAQFYLNPRRAFRHMSKIRSANQVRGVFAAIRVLLTWLFRKGKGN